MKGTVIKSTGSWYHIKDDSGGLYECRMVGKFRLNEKELTNPIAVGDQVIFNLETSTKGIVTEILPRQNYVTRQSPRQKHQLHLIASNIDQAIVMVTIQKPNFKPGFLDRYLIMTEPSNIPTIIVFNKIDIYSDYSKKELHYFQNIYQNIGYKTIAVSALTQENLYELKAEFSNKTTLIGGQSGVGKSTLISSLFPDLKIKISEISEKSGKGVHSTTFAEMFELDKNTSIIDTPGIKTLSFNYLAPFDLAHNFKEFFKLSNECKFGGKCLHRHEPDCEVKRALEGESVSPIRYQNYLQILEEIENQNYWERKKG